MTDWRRWRTCWCDRRNSLQRHSLLALLTFTALAFWGITYAGGKSDGGVDSLTEHSEVLITTAAYIIITLLSGCIGLVIWNYRDNKNAQREHEANITKSIEDLKEEVHSREQLLLDTRKMLLELHAEHRLIMKNRGCRGKGDD